MKTLGLLLYVVLLIFFLLTAILSLTWGFSRMNMGGIATGLITGAIAYLIIKRMKFHSTDKRRGEGLLEIFNKTLTLLSKSLLSFLKNLLKLVQKFNKTSLNTKLLMLILLILIFFMVVPFVKQVIKEKYCYFYSPYSWSGPMWCASL